MCAIRFDKRAAFLPPRARCCQLYGREEQVGVTLGGRFGSIQVWFGFSHARRGVSGTERGVV